MVNKAKAISLVLLGCLSFAACSVNTQEKGMAGDLGAPGLAEHDLAGRFAASLNPENTRAHLKIMSAKPHHTGSRGNKEVAEYIASQFRSWGFETKIEIFYALVPSPIENRVELLSPHHYEATLAEPFIDGFTPEHTDESLPPFSAYSADGDVTAEAVYANYGMPEDYDRLAEAGISVEGRIVIARFGRAFRGVKPRVAYDHGALGLILISDPAEYGHTQGLVYPEGRFLPEFGHQRGSLLNLAHRTGDPLTPGVGATEKREDFSLESLGDVISPIPVIPVSAQDIGPILGAMTGPAAPPEWQGALPMTYRFGGSIKVRMKVQQDWKITPLYNVVARLEGGEYPDEWILRGNNHDVWNYGAEDALSGLAAMMEEARAIAELTRTGWQPKRTLVYIAWDGEEYGLLGSTEWAETHARELKEKAVVYLNSGPVTPGFFWAGGSHSLESLVNDVAKTVKEPRFDATLYDRLAAHIQVSGTEDQKADLEAAGRMRLDALGVGSDWTPFLQHLGIPSLYLSFEGEVENGVYHSIYDTFELYDRLGDTAYDYLAKLAEVDGRIMIRFADADVLPFDFTGMAFALADYVDELERLDRSSRSAHERERELSLSGAYRLAGVPGKAPHETVAAEDLPHLDFEPLKSAVARLEESVDHYKVARDMFDPSAVASGGEGLKRLNAILFRAEQALLSQDGLPGRPWYRHSIYAPGTFTGYEVKTLPGIREAIEFARLEEAQREITDAAQLIDAYAAEIDKARAIMKTEKE